MKDYNEGHPSSVKISEDVEFLEPTVFNDPAEFTNDDVFNSDEIAHYKEHGFVVKRGLVNSPDSFEQALDFMWENVPREILDRNDPATWIDAPHEKWTTADAARVGLFMRGNWKMRSRGEHGIGTQEFLVNGIANHPSMHKLAAQMLGCAVEPCHRVRGVYGVFPHPKGARWSLGPHGDYMASQFSAMVLIDEIPPHSGGFTVWPGSHIQMHLHWDSVHGSTISDEKEDSYPLARDHVLRAIRPVEFSGSAGDVVFWHPRLIHSAGVNHSMEEGKPIVRVIVPCDYQRKGLSYFDDLIYGPGPAYQYWVDTRNFREDVASAPDNMWSNWAI